MILEGRGVRARASQRLQIVLLLFLLVRRYIPAQDPIEQTLTPRDDVGCEEEREKKHEEERAEYKEETG